MVCLLSSITGYNLKICSFCCCTSAPSTASLSGSIVIQFSINYKSGMLCKQSLNDKIKIYIYMLYNWSRIGQILPEEVWWENMSKLYNRDALWSYFYFMGLDCMLSWEIFHGDDINGLENENCRIRFCANDELQRNPRTLTKCLVNPSQVLPFCWIDSLVGIFERKPTIAI